MKKLLVPSLLKTVKIEHLWSLIWTGKSLWTPVENDRRLQLPWISKFPVWFFSADPISPDFSNIFQPRDRNSIFCYYGGSQIPATRAGIALFWPARSLELLLDRNNYGLHFWNSQYFVRNLVRREPRQQATIHDKARQKRRQGVFFSSIRVTITCFRSRNRKLSICIQFLRTGVAI